MVCMNETIDGAFVVIIISIYLIDNFNVYGWNSPNNFFQKYSIRGPNTTRSYRYSLRHDTETYNFIGVDACLDPSPKRPFNFIGLLNDKDISRITQMKA